MEDEYVKFNFKGRKITSHVRIYNPNGRKTLLALHGIGTYAAVSFDEFANHTPQAYRIVAPDWIGSGETSKLLDKRDVYGSRYCTDWLELLIPKIQKEGILEETFSIFGISMAALGIAESYPIFRDNIRKVIFQNPAGLDKRINRRFAFALSSGIFRPSILKIIVNNDFLWKNTLKWEEGKRERLRKDLRNGGLEFAVMLRHGRTGFTPFGRMRDSHYLPEQFAEIDKPVLLIYGENDDIFYEQGYLEFARTKPNWKIKMIKEAKHSIIGKDPKKVADAIESFLD